MPTKTISLVHNETHVLHQSDTASPENPERLERIIKYLRGRTTLFTDGIAKLVTGFSPAALDDLKLVHDPNYIEVIERLCQKGHVFLGDSTYLAPNSFKAALDAVGGTVEAVRGVLDGEYSSGFALVRPPGHHASADRFGGYCIFNNLAIAARWAQRHRGVEKVMFVDLDAHAGNGTMRIFYDDPTVFTISLHRDPHDYYPQDGFGHQIGTGKGRGYCANIEMPEGSGDEEYALAFDAIVMPLVGAFSPDLILVPIGFDAHYTELHTGLQMTINGYHRLISLLRGAQKPLVLGMEGGYNRANPMIAHAVIHALAGLQPPMTEEHDQLSAAATRRVSTHTILKGKLKEMRALLADYHNI
ncbi:MAG: histone deacetylase [Candidatus Thermoplasmatota archaeon]